MRYVVLPPEVIGEVMRGERTQLPVTVPADPGTILALKTGPNRRPTTLMEIAACDPDAEGWTLTLRPHTYPDQPRLLMPAGRPKGSVLGYTDQPYLSMVDEPEAVDTETQDRLVAEAFARDAKRKRAQSLAARRDRELLSIVERLELAKHAARVNGITIHAEVKAIHRMQRRGRPDGLIAQELARVERIVYREAA